MKIKLIMLGILIIMSIGAIFMVVQLAQRDAAEREYQAQLQAEIDAYEQAKKDAEQEVIPEPELEYKIFEDESGLWTVAIPNGFDLVKEEEVSTPMSFGRVTRNGYSAQHGVMLYGVEFYDYPKGAIALLDNAAIKKSVIDNVVAKTGGDIISEEETTVQDYPAITFTVKSDTHMLNSTVIVVDRRIYNIYSVIKNEDYDNELSYRFLSSFALTEETE